MQNKKQLIVLEQQNNDLQSLYNLTSKITESLDPSKVAQTAVDSLPQGEVMLGGSIALLNEDKTELLSVAVTRNKISDAIQNTIGDYSKYVTKLNEDSPTVEIIRTVIKQNKPFSTTNLADIMSPPIPKRFIKPVTAILQLKSAVIYPLFVRGEPIGVVMYYLKRIDFHDLEEEEKRLFQTYTSQIAIALENANLYDKSQQIQANLQDALSELQESRRRERDMIDIMGHELRTPMSIIRNVLSMMDMIIQKDGSMTVDKQKKYVDMALESARREANLIETLLSATKADAKGFQLTFEKIHLLDVVHDSLVGFTSQAKKKGLDLSFMKDVSMKNAFVYADRTRIQEIADNFVSNAVKYTNEGTVEIILEETKDLIWFKVKDTGIGIGEADIPSLGKKFFRAQQYSETNNLNIIRPGGTGLGL